jgi:radical SAM protein with 4Fe4S-binding SPASM domain
MYSWRAFWIKFLKRETVLLGASCNVGMDAFCIMPGADVFPCRRFVLKIGNLLDSGLEEIMHSSVLMGIINSRRKGRCSGCGILDCRGCPALSYLLSGDYLSEDTQCVYEEFPKDTIKTERRQ